MSDSNSRPPLTLEDLLRLKRAERPPPEFWVRFEGELRQKQLAALLQSRPWWQTIPLFLAHRRAFIPLGAAAIVAFALVSIRIYTPVQVVQTGALISSNLVDSPVLLPSTVISGGALLGEPSAAVAPVATAEPQSNQNTVAALAVPLSEHLPEQAVKLTPWSAPLPVQSISAKLIASDVEPLAQNNLRLIRSVIGNPTPLAGSQLQRSGGAIAELASVSALASKRARLLAQFNERQFIPEPQAPANIRERLTRHLSEARLNDHFPRVGLKGDQVSLRF